MEEENWRNKYESNFNKFQRTVSSAVEIIWKIFWIIERMFPNNFWILLGMLKKRGGKKMRIGVEFHNYFVETATKFCKKCWI